MLELEHIQKAFDGVPVLKDLSLQVEDGEIVSILGPSGCGKTTLLNIILGIVDADQGEIRYSGEDLTRTPMEKRGFNIVFQDYALFPNLNVQQNITYGLRNKPGISSREEVDELIDLLLDVVRDEDHAILISSHIVSDLEKLCDTIAFLHKGRLLLCEDKDTLREEYALWHGTAAQLEELAPDVVVSQRVTPYGAEALVKRDGVPTGSALTPVSIEELFVLMVKGEKNA